MSLRIPNTFAFVPVVLWYYAVRSQEAKNIPEWSKVVIYITVLSEYFRRAFAVHSSASQRCRCNSTSLRDAVAVTLLIGFALPSVYCCGGFAVVTQCCCCKRNPWFPWTTWSTRIFYAVCLMAVEVPIKRWIFRISLTSPAAKSAIRAGHCAVCTMHDIHSCANSAMNLAGILLPYHITYKFDIWREASMVRSSGNSFSFNGKL